MKGTKLVNRDQTARELRLEERQRETSASSSSGVGARE